MNSVVNISSKFVAFLQSIKLNDFNSSYKWICYIKDFGRFCSVDFSRSVVSNYLRPHEL